MPSIANRPLTDRQITVLRYILDHTMEYGFQPSYREMCLHFGWSSPHAANRYVYYLGRAGYVEIPDSPGRGHAPGRAIRIIKLPDGTPFRGFTLK